MIPARIGEEINKQSLVSSSDLRAPKIRVCLFFAFHLELLQIYQWRPRLSRAPERSRTHSSCAPLGQRLIRLQLLARRRSELPNTLDIPLYRIATPDRRITSQVKTGIIEDMDLL